MRVPNLIGVLCLFVGSHAEAAPPFRLLTTESASNPPSTVVLGLQEAGANLGSVFVDTNPLFDAALTPNLGAKFVVDGPNAVSFTIGARYLHFVGSDVVERKAKAMEPTLNQFSLDFRGVLAYAGATLETESANFHFNFQWAEVSTSKAVGIIAASDFAFGENWGGIVEAGYDLANRQPRLSAGIYRSGPTFGLRLGATYVKIDDPLLQYRGLVPVIDLYWLMGG